MIPGCYSITEIVPFWRYKWGFHWVITLPELKESEEELTQTGQRC